MNDTAMATPVPVPRQRRIEIPVTGSAFDVDGTNIRWIAEEGWLDRRLPDHMTSEHRNVRNRHRWRKLVFRLSQLPSAAKHVGAYLEDYAPNIFPGEGTIRAETGLTESDVTRAIRILECFGWIASRKGRPGVSNRYVLTFPTEDVMHLGAGLQSTKDVIEHYRLPTIHEARKRKAEMGQRFDADW